MYKCGNCGAVFEEPGYETISHEDYCGVGHMFPRASHHYFTLAFCPECHSDDIDDYYEDEEEEDDRIAYYERQGDEYV